MSISHFFKITLHCLAALAILLVTCSVYKDIRTPNVAKTGDNNKLEYGLACSSENDCVAATILIGQITMSAAKQVDSFASAIKDRGLFCFHSAGGSGDAMISLSKTIQRHGLSTCTADKYIVNNDSITGTVEVDGKEVESGICASACGFVLLSASNRHYIGQTPMVGIHAPITMLDLCFCDIALPFSISNDGKYIDDLISSITNIQRKNNILSYYEHSLNVPSDDMYFLTKAELKKYDVFTKKDYLH